MKNYDTPAPTNKGVLHDSSGLEFPDWSGMKPYRSRLTFEEAARWNEEMLSLFPPRKKSPEAEAARRCDVEFVL